MPDGVACFCPVLGFGDVAVVDFLVAGVDDGEFGAWGGEESHFLGVGHIAALVELDFGGEDVGDDVAWGASCEREGDKG